MSTPRLNDPEVPAIERRDPLRVESLGHRHDEGVGCTQRQIVVAPDQVRRAARQPVIDRHDAVEVIPCG